MHINMKKAATLKDITSREKEVIIVKNHLGMTYGENIRPARSKGKIETLVIETVHLCFVLVTQGETEIIINLAKKHVKKDTLVVLTQGSIVELANIPPDLELQFIDFKFEQLKYTLNCNNLWEKTNTKEAISTFREEKKTKSDGLPSMLMFEGESYIFHLTSNEAVIYRNILSMLGKTMKEGYINTALKLLTCLYDIGKEAFLRSQPKNSWKDIASRPLLNKFFDLINQHCDVHRALDFYAQELCLNKSYMSILIRKTSGKTAAEWIEHITMLRIKTLLANTNMTINQIADKMHFKEPQNLSRYFKRLSGQSPTEFRQKSWETKY